MPAAGFPEAVHPVFVERDMCCRLVFLGLFFFCPVLKDVLFITDLALFSSVRSLLRWHIRKLVLNVCISSVLSITSCPCGQSVRSMSSSIFLQLFSDQKEQSLMSGWRP